MKKERGILGVEGLSRQKSGNEGVKKSGGLMIGQVGGNREG